MISYVLLAFLLFPASTLFTAGHTHHSPNAHHSAISHHSAIPPKTNLPKVGTMIVNTYYVTDSSGTLVPKSKANPKLADDTLRVIRSGASILGRENCAEFADLGGGDTTLISYAKNGDLYLRTLGKDTSWNLLPFGLPPAKVIRMKLDNDTGNLLLHEYDMPHTRTWEVLGSDTASVGGKIYRCIKLQIVDIRQYQGSDWDQGTLYWYAPEIGYFVRMNFGWNGPYFLNQQLKE